MAERPEDLNLPIAAVQRLIKEALPDGVIVSKEARHTISRASSVFVLYLTTCAVAHANKCKRKTLAVNDIIAACGDMEFDSFVPSLNEALKFRKDFLAANVKKVPAKPTKETQEEETEEGTEEGVEGEEEVEVEALDEPKSNSAEVDVEDNDELEEIEENDEGTKENVNVSVVEQSNKKRKLTDTEPAAEKDEIKKIEEDDVGVVEVDHVDSSEEEHVSDEEL